MEQIVAQGCDLLVLPSSSDGLVLSAMLQMVEAFCEKLLLERCITPERMEQSLFERAETRQSLLHAIPPTPPAESQLSCIQSGPGTRQFMVQGLR
jgi:hypothetical protein